MRKLLDRVSRYINKFIDKIGSLCSFFDAKTGTGPGNRSYGGSIALKADSKSRVFEKNFVPIPVRCKMQSN